MTSSSKLVEVDVFLFSILVTGLSFMSISLLVLELGQFLFTRVDRKFEISPSKFCAISADWDKLGTPNFARMSQIKNY